MAGKHSEVELVEKPAMDLLAALGWQTVDAWSETFGPTGTLGRDSASQAILVHRLRDALAALNPQIPDRTREDAVTAFTRDRSLMEPTRANQQVHRLLIDGCKVEWKDANGDTQLGTVRYLDWNDSLKNDWLAASQVWMHGPLHKRRLDTVLFVNGIPLVLLEYKEPGTPVAKAYDDNLTDYRDTIPQLFWPNGFVILSNGASAKVGATHAPWGFFSDWRYIDATKAQGKIKLETAIRGTCEHDRLLDLIANFVSYSERPGKLVKILARNHQVLGVNASIEKLHETRSTGDRRLGVFWHTQGSGKSLSMLWFTQKVLRTVPGAWTFVMVTDRKELDDQLYGEFVDAGAITPEARAKAQSVDDLRSLLREDHRYVFTLIQKFALKRDKIAGAIEETMPELSARDDIIVITDEAHRSQYDTLALNMRQALPNASFMGFTGTPLLGDEELTKKEFGDYVSTYTFRDAIEDGATVPLYYENRIPEIQLINDDFEDELSVILEEAELDEEAEGTLVKRFGRQHHLITRPERLATIAHDLVRHFVGRGFQGKAMYVGIDKATAVRMYDLVRVEWVAYLAELRTTRDAMPELERPWINSQIVLMETTDMAVVVSQAQNEIADLAKLGLDIKPHRERMNQGGLDDRFKDTADPFRLVFVCAMWMTGFDAPACSTIYLDRPMRDHTLMQTIARANRVFADKANGTIVDYIGVFRNLERALAVYASGEGKQDLGLDAAVALKEQLVDELGRAVEAVVDLCDRFDVDVDVDELRRARGFDFIALRTSAMHALIANPAVRDEFLSLAAHARKLFKAVLPDAAAAEHQGTVAVIRAIAVAIDGLSGRDAPDLSRVIDAVDDLLDRSVGAEEYVIRAAAEGADPDPLVGFDHRIDLGQIDFAALAAKFAGRKQAESERLATLLRRRAIAGATLNPTRYDLVERIEKMIAAYNAGSVNSDVYLQQLVQLSLDLSAEEQRAVEEDLSEEELAIFDLLTRPDPPLTDEERKVVRDSAKQLLARIHDRLVLDWRSKADATAAVRVEIREVLDPLLPSDPYPPELFDQKVEAIYEHLAAAYEGETVSIYTTVAPVATLAPAAIAQIDLDTVTTNVVDQIRHDAAFAALVAQQLGALGHTASRTVAQLIENDEDDAVEFKSTARWDLKAAARSPAMEDAVIKTVAGFLNTEGGTLLIGVTNERNVVGLSNDYTQVKPTNGDGFINWLTTMLINAIAKPAVMRTRARIVVHDDTEICRVDVSRSPHPVYAKTSKASHVFFVRMNNSTRDMNEVDRAAYLADPNRWPPA